MNIYKHIKDEQMEQATTATWYDKQLATFKGLGYPNADSYFASKLWKGIVNQVMGRSNGRCEVCGSGEVEHIHSRSHWVDAYEGRVIGYLLGCCDKCFQWAWYDGDVKVEPEVANKRFSKIASGRGYALPGLCQKCKKNPVKAHKELCGSCEKWKLPIPKPTNRIEPKALTPIGKDADLQKERDTKQKIIDYCKLVGYPEPIEEYQFSGGLWRFDLAWIDEKIAVEIHGGVWIGGHHVSAEGFSSDRAKMNQAMVLGWRVIETTYDQINRGEFWNWLNSAFELVRKPSSRNNWR